MHPITPLVRAWHSKICRACVLLSCAADLRTTARGALCTHRCVRRQDWILCASGTPAWTVLVGFQPQ
ncbi:hypothetical protein MRX96_030174 [Rhipicephalus microplus]